jgi:hypothetical protein
MSVIQIIEFWILSTYVHILLSFKFSDVLAGPQALSLLRACSGLGLCYIVVVCRHTIKKVILKPEMCKMESYSHHAFLWNINLVSVFEPNLTYFARESTCCQPEHGLNWVQKYSN